MNEAGLILGMMLVTVLVRYPVLALMGRVRLPRGLLRALRYVPVAVLCAITVPAVLSPRGVLDLSLSNAHLAAGLAAVAVSWKTGNLLVTIAAGMGTFFIWRAVWG